jgi:hypothetical protein
MRTFIGLLAAAMLAIVLIPATTAEASPPLGVEITVQETISTTIPGGGGPFVATGPAVDAGVMCPSGATINTALTTSGSGTVVNLGVEKLFTCDDGSGTFVVKMRVSLNTETGFTSARWNAKRGTGDYANLHGSGGLEGTPTGPGTIEDFYFGKLKG